MHNDTLKKDLSCTFNIDLKETNAAENLLNSLVINRFSILKNHDVSLHLLDDIYSKWHNFFNTPKKTAYLRSDISDEGYVPINKEKAVGQTRPDCKEYYQTHWQGKYPDFIDCDSTKKLISEFVELGYKVVSLLEQALPKSLIEKMIMPLSEMLTNSDRHGFRVIHYPAISDPPRAAVHTDICFLTIIPMATSEGLELQDMHGHWHQLNLKDSEILIFNGDMIEMATQGYIGATFHRVTRSTEPAKNASRFSFPVFIHPRREVELQNGLTAIEALKKRLTEIGFKGDLLKY